MLSSRGVIAAMALATILSARTPEPRDKRVPLRHVTPHVVRLAESFLGLPMGAERYVDVDGRHCLFVVEPHFHPAGYPRGPHGWHKGVTVYEVP